MRLLPTLFLLIALLPINARGELPERGGMYMGVAYTTNKNNYPETEDDMLPGDQIDNSFFIPTAALQYDYEDMWIEYKITPIYWDITAMLTYAKDKNLEQTLFSSGILGHGIIGRNYFHGDRYRAGFGLGFGEYGIETEALEAGYFFTLDLAAKVDYMLTDSYMGRFRVRYDIPIGKLQDVNTRAEDNKSPRFLSFNAMILPYGSWFIGFEYWKVLTRNSKADRVAHFGDRARLYPNRAIFNPGSNAEPPEPSIDLDASRIFFRIGKQFYGVDD